MDERGGGEDVGTKAGACGDVLVTRGDFWRKSNQEQ